jgi:Nuclease-related domain
MAYDVDRQPGTWVRARAAHRERLIWLLLAAWFAATAGYWLLALSHRVDVVGALSVFGVAWVAQRYGSRYIDVTARWFRGAHAEESVGVMLNELRREGWILMHDVEQKYEGNIDHIAWSPKGGVFLIETKARRYEAAHLTKVKRQAAKLHDELGSWVTPVICLHERRNGKPFRPDKVVWVVPRQHLLEWLRAQRNKPVPFERLARYADHIS